MDDLDELQRVKSEVEQELLEIPGVTGVGVGYKIVAGKKTDVLCIRVYVAKKQAVEDAQLIPSQIQGYPTDVIESRWVLHDTT